MLGACILNEAEVYPIWEKVAKDPLRLYVFEHYVNKLEPVYLILRISFLYYFTYAFIITSNCYFVIGFVISSVFILDVFSLNGSNQI